MEEGSLMAEDNIDTGSHFVKGNWKLLLAVFVIAIVVFAGLAYSQPWSKVTLMVYNETEEPLIFNIYVDGIAINHAVQMGANHTLFVGNGGGIFGPMNGYPGNVTLHAVMGTHEYGIDVSRYSPTSDGDVFAGDGVVDVSKAVSVGLHSSKSVVLVIT